MRLRTLILATSLLLSQAAVASELVKPTLTPNPPGWPLIMSTYLGGSGQDGSHEFPYYMDAVEDSGGNLIIAAITTSTDLPATPGSYQCTTCGGIDILIAKLNTDLTSILAMVRLGGTGEDTYPRIALGNGGRIYIIARTTSTNYPTTTGAYSRTRRGSGDFVVTAFDSLLSTVVASTYFGGNGVEDSPSLVVDSAGDVYISGHVAGTGVPTTPGVVQTTYGGGGTDCFVSRFSSNLNMLKASTLLGGRYSEEAGDLGLFFNGDVVIGLGTHSDNYPTTSGAFDTSFNGTPGEDVESTDCAITRLNADLTEIIASTLVGGGAHDRVSCIDTDEDGNLWFSGFAFSQDYPTSTGAFDPVHAPLGTHEEFVAKLDGGLTQLTSTYLSPGFTVGGTPQINHIMVDASGLIYVTGLAWDSIYMTPDAYDPTWNESVDHCIMVLTNDLSHVVYSTVMGGLNFESDSKTVSVRDGIATIVGVSRSSDYPTTSNAVYPNFIGGASDITVTRLGIMGPCCRGATGNIDCDGLDGVDISDLSALIDNLYISLAPLCCPKEANVDGSLDGNVDISDLSGLIDFLYISFTPTAGCL